MGKRIQGSVIGVLVGGFIAGGVAYAVTVVPPNSSDRYYACVSTAGVVRYGTMRLNVTPTSCPRAGDTVRSWNAEGPKGDTGDQGPAGSPAKTQRRATRLITLVDTPTQIVPTSTEHPETTHFDVDVTGCDEVTVLAAAERRLSGSESELAFRLRARLDAFPEVVAINQDITGQFHEDPSDRTKVFANQYVGLPAGIAMLSVTVQTTVPVAQTLDRLALNCGYSFWE